MRVSADLYECIYPFHILTHTCERARVQVVLNAQTGAQLNPFVVAKQQRFL